MNLTKAVIDRLPLPAKIQEGKTEQKRYYDDKLKGFGIRVTSGGSKSFFVEKLVSNRLKRMTIGRYPGVTTEQARKEAQKLLGKIACGINPLAEKKAQRLKSYTLSQVLNDYLVMRKSLKTTTILDYKSVLNQVVPDWLNKPLLNITRDAISRRHTSFGESNSQARANLAMRVIRALFNFAMEQYRVDDGHPLIIENPVKRLSHTRAWYRIERRQTVIKSHQLADWYNGLMALSQVRSLENAEMWQDYFLLVLFTGLRRSEALSMKWSNVDLKAKTFTLLDTKNRNSHTLPLSDYLYELFLRRQKNALNDFVFPAESRTGHIVEPRKAMLKTAELSQVDFTIHDLRRTFITIAESIDIPIYALKRLLNHSLSGDVTAGYIVMDIERLRIPMQKITDYLLKLIGIKETTVAYLQRGQFELKEGM